MADEKKRIYELSDEALTLASDDYIAVDSSTNGTRKYKLIRIEGQIGDLSTLDTTAKGSLVAAVNELKGDIGDLSELETTAKTDLVSAINEAASTGGGSGGSPKGVTLASQMTDTDENYLYLGDETGYDYGYIYVYLSGAWTKTTLYGVGQTGADGQNGEDGFSPIVTVTEVANVGVTISVTDEEGTTTATVENGTATDAQVNAWLENHPEATTTVQDGSITQKKLAFDAVEGDMSPNLIDTSSVTSARFSDANGSIQSFTSGSYYNYWRMTDYIDVSDHIGEYISITNHNGYCFYNSSKVKINGSGESLGMSYPQNSSTSPILIPADVSYVRLVYWYRDDAITSPMANFGNTLLKYSVYGTVLLKPKVVFNDNIGEKIKLANIESDKIAEKTVSNNLIPLDNIMVNYDFNNSTGEPTSVAAGYYSALTDYIPVKGSTTYLGLFKNRVAFYDESKNYLSYASTGTFKTPSLCRYVRLLVTSSGGINEHQFYLVEGGTLPFAVYPYGSYFPYKSIEMFGLFKSALDRLKPLYDPRIKTAIGIYGDSNTAGLSSGASGTYYQNCWANLLCSRIEELFDRDITIYPFGEYGSWYGTAYSGTLIVPNNTNAFASLDFYGSSLTINFGTTQTGTASIVIDDNEPVSVVTSSSNQYTVSNLAETKHTVLITATSGYAQISSIVIHKYATATNLGSVGSGTSYLPTSNTTYDIYITVLGTNDRGRTIDFVVNNHYVFAKTQMNRGAEVIMITPTPAADGYETGATSGIKMAEIESAISEVNGTCNLEHISFYQYLLEYCTYTGTTLSSLFNDTLHMKETTHAIIYKFMCDKLGLGQPIASYL